MEKAGLHRLVGGRCRECGRFLCREFVIEKEEAVRIRSSVLFLGALLGKIKKAVLPQPGGCAIGMRPIDLHLESLRQLGAVIEEENGGSWKENPNQDQRETQVSAQTGMLTADGTHMHGAHIRLRFPSVGATEDHYFCGCDASGRNDCGAGSEGAGD